ncbi:MAG: tetratricopeptide repeat protein [Gammaproteobacteria bacterium]
MSDMFRNFILFIALTVVSAAAGALEFKDGLDAYKRHDLPHAVRIFTMLAERGDAQAQFAMGMLYNKGEGVEKNDATAVQWYTRSAEAGFARAQLNLAVMYENGEGVAKDRNVARQWLREAATQGNADALTRLQKQAEENDVDTQFDLAGICAVGNGIDKDEAMARKWYERAAKSGNARARYNLAVLSIAAGDAATAARWYEKAAAQQHAAAAFNLALLYLNGNGVAKDAARAVQLLQQAAKAGTQSARYQLALLYSDGKLVARDAAQAQRWFEAAARSGHVPSQVDLGSLYANNGGADLIKACAWYMMAANSSAEAKRNLDRITPHLNAGELDQARQMLPSLLDASNS